MSRAFLFLTLILGLICHHCDGSGECMPFYGRAVRYNISYIEEHIGVALHWEDCGRMCFEHETCLFWSWTVPKNAVPVGHPLWCRFYDQALDWEISTTLEPYEISGDKFCYRSDYC